jgi:hypothetical protein
LKSGPCLASLLATICAVSSTASSQPVTVGTTPSDASIRGNPETDRCLKEAAKDGAPSISIEIQKMFKVGHFVRVVLSVNNLAAAPIWLNLKPFAREGSGLAADQQLFVTIHAPQERSGWGIEYDAVMVPERNYGIIEPHKRRDVSVSVNGIGLDLSPGTYRVDACFWDRNQKIPKPPKGAMTVRGPVGVSQAVTVAP